MKTIIMTAFFAVPLFIAASIPYAAAQSAFDGKWKMDIEYSKSSSVNPICSGYLFPDPFTVEDGKISGTLRHSDRGVVFISGEVSADGGFTAHGAGNAGEATATGKLSGSSGTGTWEETTRTFCDGTWSATKK